ncbi:MAG: hypothetical protein AAGN82_19465 [Myxococcota bacterium]
MNSHPSHIAAARTYAVSCALALALGSTACADGPDGGSASQTENVVAAGTAVEYPESVLIFGRGYPAGRWMAGTLIAPDVVLTFDVIDRYRSVDVEVIAPHVDQERMVRDVAIQSWGERDEWPEEWHELDRLTFPVVHEVALLKLESPIELESYPVLAAEPPVDGTGVVRIGTNAEGQFIGTTMKSHVDEIFSGDPYNLPTSLVAFRKTMFGDGGGGVFVAGDALPHRLVAVNYGYGNGEDFVTDAYAAARDYVGAAPLPYAYDYMVRVDLVKAWIDDTMAQWDAEAE